MSNRFRPAWLLVLAALSTSALAKAPETVNIGYQKANIFALLKYRGTLDESLKKQGIAVRWVEFPAGPQMLEGLNVGSIDLAATGDAPPAFAQAAQADLVYLAHSPANPKTEAIVVPEQSAIHSVADLKGKRVGLNKGSDVTTCWLPHWKKRASAIKTSPRSICRRRTPAPLSSAGRLMRG